MGDWNYSLKRKTLFLALLWTVSEFVGVLQVDANALVKKAIFESQKKLDSSGFYANEVKKSSKSILNSPKECPANRMIELESGDSGAIEQFPCWNVDFLSFLSLKDMDIVAEEVPGVQGTSLNHTFGLRGADIWGWLSPSGAEVTVMALDNGVNVVNTTDPVNPCIIAKLPTRRPVDIWADVKVMNNTLYHVKDARFRDTTELGDPTTGIEVYDLIPMDEGDCHDPEFEMRFIDPSFIVSDHGRSHNLITNPESGLLFSVGTEKCNGGMLVFDTKIDRLRPQLISEICEDDYTHDAQCLIYDGPDEQFHGSEICFAFNEDTLTIWDLSNPTTPEMLSRTTYPNQAYSHQGWVNDDLTLILLDDELDEVCNENFTDICQILSNEENLTSQLKTTTNVFNIENLSNPVFNGAYVHADESIDHNLYVWGSIHRKGWGGSPPMENHPIVRYAYMNNYLAGIRVIDIESKDYKEWKEVGYFDVSPSITEIEFAGVWSGYMHPSGVYAASSIERGLFLLRPHMAFEPVITSEGKQEEDKEFPIGLVVSMILLSPVVMMMILVVVLKIRGEA